MWTLTYRHELSSILEPSEQVFHMWLTTMPHVRTATAIGSLASSYLISTGSFSPTRGVHTRLQIWWPWTALSKQYISGTMTWLPTFSSSLCCHISHTESCYSISSPPQWIGTEHNVCILHFSSQLRIYVWCQLGWATNRISSLLEVC